MINLKSGITAAALGLSALGSTAQARDKDAPASADESPMTTAVEAHPTNWISWASGAVAAAAGIGAIVAIAREELRNQRAKTSGIESTSKDSVGSVTEGLGFIDALLKITPDGIEGEEMRNLLNLKRLQLEGGWVTWDWRPGLKMFVEALLPDDASSMDPWQKEISARVAELPDRLETVFRKPDSFQP
jgi:hypothetical protein